MNIEWNGTIYEISKWFDERNAMTKYFLKLGQIDPKRTGGQSQEFAAFFLPF